MARSDDDLVEPPDNMDWENCRTPECTRSGCNGPEDDPTDDGVVHL